MLKRRPWKTADVLTVMLNKYPAMGTFVAQLLKDNKLTLEKFQKAWVNPEDSYRGEIRKGIMVGGLLDRLTNDEAADSLHNLLTSNFPKGGVPEQFQGYLKECRLDVDDIDKALKAQWALLQTSAGYAAQWARINQTSYMLLNMGVAVADLAFIRGPEGEVGFLDLAILAAIPPLRGAVVYAGSKAYSFTSDQVTKLRGLLTTVRKGKQPAGGVPGMALPGVPNPDVYARIKGHEAAIAQSVAQRMKDIGVEGEYIGMKFGGSDYAAFDRLPRPQGGGNVRPELAQASPKMFRSGIMVDEAILDSTFQALARDRHVVSADAARAYHEAWARASEETRLDAVIAHEYTELKAVLTADLQKYGNEWAHYAAIKNAPSTALTISTEARELLRLHASALGL